MKTLIVFTCAMFLLMINGVSFAKLRYGQNATDIQFETSGPGGLDCVFHATNFRGLTNPSGIGTTSDSKNGGKLTISCGDYTCTTNPPFEVNLTLDEKKNPKIANTSQQTRPGLCNGVKKYDFILTFSGSSADGKYVLKVHSIPVGK